MADSAKRIERAEKFLQKGKVDSALEEYLALIQEEPGNDSARQTAADLYLQLNCPAEAAALLSEVFDRQIAAGDNARAAVTYKKLARLVPPKLGQVLRYAQVSEHNASPREAIDAYEAAIKGFRAAGRKNEALSALRRVVELAPTSQNLERVAEAAAQLNDRETAAEAYLKIGLAEEHEGHIAFAWYHRAYEQNKNNPEIAYRYGKGLLDKGEGLQAVQVLAPPAQSSEASPDYREAYGLALAMTQRAAEAYPILWPIYQGKPNKLEDAATLVGELLKQGHAAKALGLARKLGEQHHGTGTWRDYVTALKEHVAPAANDPAVLEYLIEQFNSANREHDYCEALLRLYELRYAGGDFQRAADALDRIAEVDPYSQGLSSRLETLRGKIDDSHYRAVANRLQKAGGMEESKSDQPVFTDSEPTVLEDLILQAEIFLQYSMRSKALERLERIRKLFPHEEQKNEKLRQLYVNAGVELPSGGAEPPTSTESPVPKPPTAAPQRSAGDEMVDSFARVAEITRNIYRQSNVRGVLFAAVNDVGRLWNASRCIAALCVPGKAPSAVLEYCAPGVKQSDVTSIVRLLAVVQTLAIERGSISIEKAAEAPELGAIQQHVSTLGIKSILASPLSDAEQQVGILVLEQTDRIRAWKNTDVLVLKSIADQMVLAVNNAKLRTLMKTLALTDEKSGLLKRSSYLDVMLAEVKRSTQQDTPMSLILLNFGKAVQLMREAGEAHVETMMQQIGQTICSNIRQTDTAVRYDKTTIALILGDTKDANAPFVVDKFRRLLSQVHVPGTETPVTVTAGIAGAVLQKDYDPIDIVTEVINRAEQALDAALAEGPNSTHALPPAAENVAVA